MVEQPNGIRWLFVRGLTRSAAHWGNFLESVKSRFPRDEVKTLELPGVGQFFKEPSPRNVEDICHLLRSQLATTLSQSSKKNVLVALSFGALPAFQWLNEFPGELAASIWINTSMPGASPPYRRLDWRNTKLLLNLFLASRPEDREPAVYRLTTSIKSYDPQVVGNWVEIAKKSPVKRKTFIAQLMAAMRFRPPKEFPPSPTWVLCGLKDKLVDPRCSFDIKKKWPKVRLLTHPDAGHDLPLDAPDWVLQQLSDLRKTLTP